MQGRFIGHGKLSHVPGVIWQLGIKSIFASSQGFCEHGIQFADKGFLSTHQLNQVRYVMLNIPAVDPGVIFSVVSTRTHPPGPAIIKGLNKLTVPVPGVKKLAFLVE